MDIITILSLHYFLKMQMKIREKFMELIWCIVVIFLANVEVYQYDTTRVQLELILLILRWLLKPGEDFQTPEAVMVYSDSGLGKMSRTFHNLI